jgi:hypothetical protein
VLVHGVSLPLSQSKHMAQAQMKNSWHSSLPVYTQIYLAIWSMKNSMQHFLQQNAGRNQSVRMHPSVKRTKFHYNLFLHPGCRNRSEHKCSKPSLIRHNSGREVIQIKR